MPDRLKLELQQAFEKEHTALRAENQALWKKVRNVLIVAILFTAIGSAAGTYAVSHEAQEKNERNACAIKIFLKAAEDARRAAANQPNATPSEIRDNITAAEIYAQVNGALYPPLTDCRGVLELKFPPRN